MVTDRARLTQEAIAFEVLGLDERLKPVREWMLDRLNRLYAQADAPNLERDAERMLAGQRLILKEILARMDGARLELKTIASLEEQERTNIQ